MKSLLNSFWISLLLATALNVGALLLIDRQARRELGWDQYQVLYPRESKQTYADAAGPGQVDAANPSRPKAEPKPKEEPQMVPFIEDQLGEHNGLGDAINSIAGDRPMESPLAADQVQAFAGHGGATLSGDEGDGKPEAMMSRQQAPQAQDGPRSSKPPPATKEQIASDHPAKTPDANSPPEAVNNHSPSTPAKPDHGAADLTQATPLQIAMGPATRPGDALMNSQARPAAGPPTTREVAPASATADATPNSSNGADLAGGRGGQPGAAQPSGDGATPADYESDPVVIVASVSLADGYVKAQSGTRWLERQKVRLSEDSRNTLAFMGRTSVTLKLTTDESGNVVDVEREHASGCDSFDQESMRAAATWWFDPPVNAKTHQPMRHQFSFTIIYL